MQLLASSALNTRLRRALPTVLAYNVDLASQYIPTGDNVADDPTRDRDCWDPEEVVPSWLAAAMAGSFGALDEPMAAEDLAQDDMARLPAPFAVAPPTGSSMMTAAKGLCTEET